MQYSGLLGSTCRAFVLKSLVLCRWYSAFHNTTGDSLYLRLNMEISLMCLQYKGSVSSCSLQPKYCQNFCPTKVF